MKNQLKVHIFSFFVIFSMLLSAVGMPILHARAATTVTVDGAYSSGKAEPAYESAGQQTEEIASTEPESHARNRACLFVC